MDGDAHHGGGPEQRASDSKLLQRVGAVQQRQLELCPAAI